MWLYYDVICALALWLLCVKCVSHNFPDWLDVPQGRDSSQGLIELGSGGVWVLHGSKVPNCCWHCCSSKIVQKIVQACLCASSIAYSSLRFQFCSELGSEDSVKRDGFQAFYIWHQKVNSQKTELSEWKTKALCHYNCEGKSKMCRCFYITSATPISKFLHCRTW